MPQKLPVVAAIPNYNMGEQLSSLLPQLAEQDYADIYVLDDASTDNSREIVEDFDNGVHFIASPENRGAGAARNLILGKLGTKSIIHFIDADIELKTERVTEVANDIMPTWPVGFVGGLAETEEGIQSIWNYGPRLCLRNDVISRVQNVVGELVVKNPERAKAIRTRFSSLLEDWPDPFSEPVRRQVFWNIEQNLLMQSEIFDAMGGFNEKYREHDIQDLAMRMSVRGLKRYFDPAMVVKFKDVNVRNYNRDLEKLKTEFKIHREFGLRNYLRPNGSFKPEL